MLPLLRQLKWRALPAAIRRQLDEERAMRTYYFDRKDGVPVRDNKGLQFAGHPTAILHSKQLAKEIRIQNPGGNRDLYIAVLDQTGREIHREPVYPDA
jgi:hypothetical protein